MAFQKRFKTTKEIADSRWSSALAPRDISFRLNVFLWAFGQNLNHFNIDNSIFVECGTGKGYMMAGACSYFSFRRRNSPLIYLVDRYEDSPLLQSKPSKKGSKSFNTLDAYTNNVKEVEEYFSIYPSVKIMKGMVPEVLNKIPNKSILFLHIDLNVPKPEEEALEFLSKKFVQGTIILFDDYGGPGG